MEKILSRGLLVLYLVILIWLVLFKLQYNILSVFHYHHRSLNLIPFAGPSIINGSFGEIRDNVIIFIPLGLLLNVNFKKVGFLLKFAFILVLSLIIELFQFISAIGATDITDVITNTVGGFLGLELYVLSSKYVNNKILDRVIIFVGILLLVLLLDYRTHLRINY
ncbi:glycopeptide resistance protein VanZ-A [Bacillus ginsengihumi]|uniref:Glycopeptide resistance protein VanZ-A n=1 Tax=Heyndrickxia ginsengihumi TaxID=363870 RepID=A0A6M0P3Y5_9BACI|nr:glycopeptide resistance protein VanZ-A [Heyndrickxia ginsengihumi]MBE6185398.1 glycopeptide resistance protein VanZ-A [Bacillus sp. (in: firmicutes)]MCM3022738.1 glycopeptide resistance protein VanZ-A [Heyndrickxia ginsengihumi]NEY18925.1 glycopeptide resistance protein VanZ-A [Heyndrickxia ginsengihumi]